MSGFRSRLRELRREGWTSSAPTGLSDDFFYLKPGKTKSGVRGVDYFVGEEELMAYLDMIDLELQKQKEKDRRDYNDAIAPQNPSDSDPHPTSTVRPSTPKEVLQSPETRLSSSPDADSSREGLIATSPHLAGKGSRTNLAEEEHGSTSSRNQKTDRPSNSSPRRNLSLAFSDVSSDDGAYSASDTSSYHLDASADESREEEAPRAATPVYRDDPNFVAPGDSLHEYAALDSDVEGEGESIYDDDEDVDFDEPNPESDDEEVRPPELHFGESLLEAVGGVEQISRGNLNTCFLADMKEVGWTAPVHQTPYPYMDEPYQMRPDGWISEDYPGLFDGEHGPTVAAMSAASSAIGAFFRFVSPHLLETIAGTSNDYFEENLDTYVEARRTKQQARKLKKTTFEVQTPEQIKEKLQRTHEISGHEVCIFIGLLIARTIAPNKEKFDNHWKTTDEGAIPRGCLNIFMTRDRFYHVSRNLHFSSNADRRAATDRAWKLRPVIDALQETFQSGFVAPPVMAFDEAMLPCTSPFNRMRIFMKDKPHRWGTKLFMLCCSKSANCIRFEVYCGKRQMQGITDEKSGPAAVLRNLRHVFGDTGPHEQRLIVTDRFYTSVVLAMQLLTMNFYSVGTIQTNRKGLCKAILPKTKPNGKKEFNRRPKNIVRGTFDAAQLLQIPKVKAVRWWDNKGVFLLAAGGSVQLDRIVRRDPATGEQIEEMCPRILKDYQSYMGGVDVHDQLRLQRYSLQLARCYKKYYKSLFLGLLDLAIINAFIISNCRRAADGKTKASHVSFLKQLYLELCQLRASDWEELLRHRGLQPTPTKSRATNTAHLPIQTDEWRKGNTVETRKRRQRASKVYSVLKHADAARGGETTFYCGGCRLKTSSKHELASRVFLCNKVKHFSNGVAASCFEIWHKHWKNGSLIPQSSRKRKIRGRRPARPGESGGDDEDGGSASDVVSSRGSTNAPHQRSRTHSSDDSN